MASWFHRRQTESDRSRGHQRDCCDLNGETAPQLFEKCCTTTKLKRRMDQG